MKKLFAITFLAMILSPVAVFAASNPLTPYWGPIVSCSAAPVEVGGKTLPPCVSFCDLLKTGQNVLKMGLTFALYVIAPVLFVWGGFMVLTAAGDPGKVKKARQILVDAVIGIAIVLGAFIIVNSFLYIMGIKFKTSDAGATQSSWSSIECSVIPNAAPTGAGAGAGGAASGSGGGNTACGFPDLKAAGPCGAGKSCLIEDVSKNYFCIDDSYVYCGLKKSDGSISMKCLGATEICSGAPNYTCSSPATAYYACEKTGVAICNGTPVASKETLVQCQARCANTPGTTCVVNPAICSPGGL